jgi:hypothetical protein
MIERAVECNEKGEWLDPGCIMRGAPDEQGMCQPSAGCPSCDQQRVLVEPVKRCVSVVEGAA